jgi:Pirin C-terminal cupin domain.
MIDPRYLGLEKGEMPEIVTKGGIKIKIICGTVAGTKGPVNDIVIDPEYLDITIPEKLDFRHPTKLGHTCFAYVIEGDGYLERN